MKTVSNTDWIINLEEMTCQNINTEIVVGFEKKGDGFLGKIKELPDKIYELWAKNENGGNLLKNNITEAEEVFLRIYNENILMAN
jgi:hypothetical protein